MFRPLPAVLATLSAALLSAAVVAGPPQIRDQTAIRFPSPGLLEWSNQATVGDIDNDGDLDVIFANGGNFSSPGTEQVQRVYINDGDGFFADESDDRLDFSGLCRGLDLFAVPASDHCPSSRSRPGKGNREPGVAQAELLLAAIWF